MRSANIKEITPAKLMPPFHKTAASGTLPMEQTKESSETIGPTKAPQIAEINGE